MTGTNHRADNIVARLPSYVRARDGTTRKSWPLVNLSARRLSGQLHAMRLIIIIVTCDLRLLVPCSEGTHLRAKRGGYAANYAPKRVTRRDAREEAFVSRESHYFDEHASDPCFSSCFFFPPFWFLRWRPEESSGLQLYPRKHGFTGNQSFSLPEWFPFPIRARRREVTFTLKSRNNGKRRAAVAGVWRKNKSRVFFLCE